MLPRKSTFLIIIFWSAALASWCQKQNENYIGAYCWRGDLQKLNRLGVSLGGNYTYVSKSEKNASGYAFAVHYERKRKVSRISWQMDLTYQRLGLSLGKPECLIEPWFCGLMPNKSIDKFDIIAFAPAIKYAAFPIGRYSLVSLVGGYAIGKILKTQSYFYFDDRTTKSPLELNGLKKTIHQIAFGVDLDYMIKPTWVASLQSRLNITNIYDKKYGNLFIPNFNISLGKQF